MSSAAIRAAPRGRWRPGSLPRRSCARLARSGSTTTTISRRAEVQQAVFAGQLALAQDRRLPVVIHTREAEADTLRLIGEAQSRGPLAGVFHCFTGDPAVAERALATGFYLSFAGIVTFPRAVELREAVRIVPLDRLLVETDAPYLAPVPHRGKRNEPAWVGLTLAAVARERGLPAAALAAAVRDNYDRLFAP